jgi:hypothetical protein
MLQPLSFLVIADDVKLRFTLVEQLLTILLELGLGKDQFSILPFERSEDALSAMFANPPLLVDLIICWDLQPARAGVKGGRPTCNGRDGEAGRMHGVLGGYWATMMRPIVRVHGAPSEIWNPSEVDWLDNAHSTRLCTDLSRLDYCPQAGCLNMIQQLALRVRRED